MFIIWERWIRNYITCRSWIIYINPFIDNPGYICLSYSLGQPQIYLSLSVVFSGPTPDKFLPVCHFRWAIKRYISVCLLFSVVQPQIYFCSSIVFTGPTVDILIFVYCFLWANWIYLSLSIVFFRPTPDTLVCFDWVTLCWSQICFAPSLWCLITTRFWSKY
jgi:hypothetical protein